MLFTAIILSIAAAASATELFFFEGIEMKELLDP